MAYTPPNTFVATQPITETQVDGNLTAVQSYVNGGVVAADLYNGGDDKLKLDQQNIVRGHYNPISNSLQMASGVAAGHHSMAAERSFVVGAATNMGSPTTPQDVYIQNSSITFYIEPGRYNPGPGTLPAKCLFQFHATPVFVPTGSLSSINVLGSAAIHLDGARQAYTRTWTRREVEAIPALAGGAGLSMPHYRGQWSNFFATVIGTEGWHTIGLEGRTFGHYIMNVAWGVTLEIYY
jgi:hypothetical protein